MSGNALLDWAILAFSLFNTILLGWLGLTVLLNAERRRVGIWLAGSGLLLGSGFFLSHTAIVGQGLVWLSWPGMVFWWTAGLVPAVMLPYSWYVVMLWYAGYWESRTAALRRRHRLWLFLASTWFAAGMIALGVGVLLLAVPAASLNSLRQFLRWSVAGIPLLGIGYSLYVVLCTALALEVLRRPGPSARLMGTLARARARPWLVAASVAQLAVSFLVTAVMVWVVQNVAQRTFYELFLTARLTLGWLDLVTCVALALTALFLGEAIVAYEVFTGRTLPRRGLRRHWRGALVMAAGFGLLGSASLTLSWPALTSILIVTLALASLSALLGRQAFAEREHAMASLRPLVSSQQLTDRLLLPAGQPIPDVRDPFRALCSDILGAETATLIAWGALAPLVGPPLRHPEGKAAGPVPVAELAGRFSGPSLSAIPVSPERFDGAIWAIPLWSQRGLSGVLLLGPRRDGGLYAQEEMDVAQAAGERLLDTQASAQLATRLMNLQRERLARHQVLDQQTRRVLHDDVLPALHAAMLELGSGSAGSASAAEALGAIHRQIADLLHQMPAAQAPAVGQLGLLGALRQAVDGELAPHFRQVHWEIDKGAVDRVEQLAPMAAEVVFYAAREAVRNAAAHGASPETGESPALWLRLLDTADLALQIEDDGVGMVPGFKDGEGHGLALHSTMMSIIGGTLSVESAAGAYTRITLTIPGAPLSHIT